jgi:hypothetical protein
MTPFFRLVDVPLDQKESALREAVAGTSRTTFFRDPEAFTRVPGSPFAYWVSESLRAMFERHPSFENTTRCARRGSSTGDDFRRLRTWWEVNISQNGRWQYFAKGGAFSPFYADIHLVADWDNERGTYGGFFGRPGRATERPEAADFYFRPGLTWPIKNRFSLKPRCLPRGCIFAHIGPTAFVANDTPADLLALQAIMSSSVFTSLVRIMAGWNFEVGLIQRTPVPIYSEHDSDTLATLAGRAWHLRRQLDTVNETSHAFVLPAIILRSMSGFDREKISAEIANIQTEIDEICFRLYGVTAEDRISIEGGGQMPSADQPDSEDADEAEGDATVDCLDDAKAMLSWAVGVAFGRFDLKLATGAHTFPLEPGPFDMLPAMSPGMAAAGEVHDILVDDPGHPDDITTRVGAVFDALEDSQNKPTDLRRILAHEFYPDHIRSYSRSRRKAPIYWQLSTRSGSYSIWLYIHSLTNDTLFRVQSEFLEPKLAFERRQLELLRVETGLNPNADARREIEAQQDFVDEIQLLCEEVRLVAPLWRPSLDDGVVLNLAPLWRLSPQHSMWQRELSATWDALSRGSYDWSELAMHLWPERVIKGCAIDRSLALTHNLDGDLWFKDHDQKWRPVWVVDNDGTWRSATKAKSSIDDLVRAHEAPRVKAALKSLAAAPTVSSPSKRGRKSKAAR